MEPDAWTEALVDGAVVHSLYGSLLFLILQPVVAFFFLLCEFFTVQVRLLDPAAANAAASWFAVALEVALLAGVVRLVKDALLRAPPAALGVREGALELSLGAAGALLFAWICLFRVHSLPAKLTLGGLESFATFFLLIFILLRWSIARKLRWGAVAAWLLSALSLAGLLH